MYFCDTFCVIWRPSSTSLWDASSQEQSWDTSHLQAASCGLHAGLQHVPLRGLSAQRGPSSGLQELKSSKCVLYSVQSTLLEAGGHRGRVSDGRSPGLAPWGLLWQRLIALVCGRVASAFPSLLGSQEGRMLIHAGWLGTAFRGDVSDALRWNGSPASSRQKRHIWQIPRVCDGG